MVISAKNGKAKIGTTEIDEVSNISVEDKSDNKAYASSSTGGKMKRVAGNGDVSGSFDCYEDPSGSGAVKGATVALKLYADGSGGSPVAYFDGKVIIDSVKAEIPIEGGDPVSYTVNFSGNPDNP